MQRGDVLFSKYDLSSSVQNILKTIEKEIDNIDGNRLLNTSTDELARYYADKFYLDIPKLDEDALRVSQSEVEVDMRFEQNSFIHDRSVPHYAKGTAVIVEIPFSGDRELFLMRGSRWSSLPPRAEIGNQIITIWFESTNFDQTTLRRDILISIENIKQHLDYLRHDIEKFNEGIIINASSHIERRRKKLLADSKLILNLGFPLKQREGAPTTYIAPEIKRKIHPIFPKSISTPYVPEPALSEADYEHILSVVENMTHVMERSPAAFAKMKEEDIRTHFLVQLNGHYDGQASGETFNYEGKTDILIRVDGKNIFIAECKFWNGRKKYLETIDQLLGYISWRDTKATIIVFNRNRDFSNVLKEIENSTKEHSGCKKLLKHRSETSWVYLFVNRDDPNRELIVTIMAFEIPS